GGTCTVDYAITFTNGLAISAISEPQFGFENTTVLFWGSFPPVLGATGKFKLHDPTPPPCTSDTLDWSAVAPDTIPPETQIIPPAPPPTTRTPAWSFTSSEPNSTFECRIDAGPWVTCSS